MARIRTVKPEFFKHYELFKAEKETKLPLRLAFEGLWLCADKEGRFKYNPTHLKLDILPYDEVDFRIVLAALEAYGFILKYSVENKKYGWIPTLKDHQRFNGTEAKAESRLPEPPKNLQKGISMEELRTLWGSAMELPENDHVQPFDLQEDESMELPTNGQGTSEEHRKGKERSKEGKGREEASSGSSLEVPIHEGVIFDIEKYLNEHEKDFAEICIASYKSKEQVSFVLKKFHLWNQQNEKYPKPPLALIAGLKSWLLNEKNISNGNGSHQQQPVKNNPKTAGVNKLLASLKEDISAAGTRNNPS